MPPVNFRTLLLSSFNPHGGRDSSDQTLYDHHIVYVEISRESAADILTMRRFLLLVQQQVQLGRQDRPSFVVIDGDQPTYKMLCEIWLESWRKHGGEFGGQRGINNCHSKNLMIHEWLIPFPGFFHAEKQAMYALCKEMLDGLGLREIAACAGLSNAHVDGILNHSHARNNRAVLFNLTCSMIIHLIDITCLEDSDVYDRVRSMHDSAKEKELVTVHGIAVPQKLDNNSKPPGRIYDQTTSLVTKDIIEVGAILRKRVESLFCQSPNGKHFVQTVLFSCLLPTVGFHVLSRTGHTDFIEAFWFKHTSILHASNHLKYQELAIFYAFFRSIIPTEIVSVLYEDKPGQAVAKLLSFTGFNRDGLDRRGWTYVHLDGLLEMLIVRHLKSLSVNFLSHLENSAAWLMEVSMFRALARVVTGASRAYGKKRISDDGGEEPGPLTQFDPNSVQWRTVASMLHLMREAGFLDLNHRGSEWLTNVFSKPRTRMNIKSDQEGLLNITNHGSITAKLHASVLFPDVFGPLTVSDREQYFSGKKFRKWTSSRKVPRASQSMSKQSGSVYVDTFSNSALQRVVSPSRRTNGLLRPFSEPNNSVSVLNERRRQIGKLKDAFHLEERTALRNRDEKHLNDIMKRWDALHRDRHLISPFADCFYDSLGNLNHPQKSSFLRYATKNGREVVYPLNQIEKRNETGSPFPASVSSSLYETSMPAYLSLQVDLMNSLHFKGDTGQRGTNLQSVVLGKMTSVLRRWLTGDKSCELKQVHFHVDDPEIVIAQKKVEQTRRTCTQRRTLWKETMRSAPYLQILTFQISRMNWLYRGLLFSTTEGTKMSYHPYTSSAQQLQP